MVDWYQVENDNEWNNIISNFTDVSFKQTYGWGRYQELMGWKVLKCACKENKKIVTAAQCFYKVFFSFFVVVICPGGPIGDLSKINLNFSSLLKKRSKAKFIYIRIRLEKEYNSQDNLSILNNGFFKPIFMLTKGLSMILNIEGEKWKRDIRRNWKRNLKKSKDLNIEIKIMDPINGVDISNLYRKMSKNKNLNGQPSEKQIHNIIKNNINNIICVEARDTSQKIIAIRAAFFLNNQAWDLFAASSSEGRSMFASYSLFFKLIEECQNIEVKTYDLSGIDPIKNPGVYNFKNGTGAKQIKFLGEYEYTNNNLFKFLVNFYMRLTLK